MIEPVLVKLFIAILFLICLYFSYSYWMKRQQKKIRKFEEEARKLEKGWLNTGTEEERKEIEGDIDNRIRALMK